ncbi:hypothetical protein GOBAR_DD23226 [Gossypium barbadense]|nr:hypothetical protein GOBAR_DD23226 [Gossypium barbadense]
MASFGVVSLFAVLLVASCVSNSEACTRDIDCLGQCKHGGFCDLTLKNVVACRYRGNYHLTLQQQWTLCSDDENCKGLPTSLLSP